MSSLNQILEKNKLPFEVDWYQNNKFKNRILFTDVRGNNYLIGVYLTDSRLFEKETQAFHTLDSGKPNRYSTKLIEYKKEFEEILK